MIEEVKSIHNGHRQRLKDKFLRYGADSLEEHEFIELLLFYALPRQNTNEIAHNLINEFGGLRDVFEADIDNLVKIEGVSYHTAMMFKLMAACVNKYVNEVNNIANAMLTPLNIHTFIKNLFYGHTNEIAYAILLDSQCVVKKIRKISSGTVNATPLYTSDIVKMAVNERYPYMILAHNHPNGNAMPSANDLQITKKLEMALSFVDVRLVDHVIVTGENVISLARHFNAMEE